jgi:polysaccharide export outer membrane protein
MKRLPFWLWVSVALASCTVNKDLLFKTPKDYVFDQFPDTSSPPARLAPNNLINFNFFTGNGHVLVEQGLGSNMMLGQGAGGMRQNQFLMQQAQLPYIIDRDGTVKLPVIGRTKLEGLTLREAEEKLEMLYSHYYNEPFVLLNVQNNRVIVSPGAGGNAQVITLVNNNTTLMEALAMATQAK